MFETRTKKCSKCKRVLPLDKFHKDKQRPDGYRVYCKACIVEKSRRYHAANREKRSEYARQWKAANPEKAREASRRWKRANRDKVSEYNRQWRAANLEKAREYNRQYREANPEKSRERARLWRAANPERFREAVREWEANNPLRARAARAAAMANRKARLLNIPGKLSSRDVLDVWSKVNFRCENPKCKDNSQFGLDHVIPLVSGGTNTPDNLRCCCKKCNSKKNNLLDKTYEVGW